MDALDRRVAALLESASGSDRLTRHVTLTSGRRPEVVLTGDPPVVVECEGEADNLTLDLAVGQVLDYAIELGAVPLLVIADDAEVDGRRRARLDQYIHILTERELRDRLQS